MVELNEQQVGFIADYLEKNIVELLVLREELLDHLCCAVEIEMASGSTFHQAQEKVFANFSEETLQRIEKETILSHQNKNNIMTKISMVALLVLMLFATSIWAVKFDPPSGSPILGKLALTSPFGWRMHPIYKEKKMHKGVDYKAPIGTPIIATADGVIQKVKRSNKGYGNLIVIQHEDAYETRYAQLSEIKVEVGQKVKKGETIALSGNSGTSTAPHLHYEVLKNGVQVDPQLYIQP